MDIHVHDRGPADDPVALQHADGDGDVVVEAEAFAVRREGVMEPAAEVRRRGQAGPGAARAIGLSAPPVSGCHREPGGGDRAAGHEPESLGHLR